MAGITIAKNNEKFKIFRTFSYRNNENKPMHRRKMIGYLLQNESKPVYNKYFKNLIASQGITLDQIYSIEIKDIPKIVDFGDYTKTDLINNVFNKKNNNISDLNNSFMEDIDHKIDLSDKIKLIINENNVDKFEESNHSVLNYGPQLLLRKIITDIGLLDILKQIFPEKWREIITLSYFLVNRNMPYMYCENWVDTSLTYLNKNNMQSQRISELLSEINYSDITNFYDLWALSRVEDEYLALDITSVSSYSSLINNVEPGYNRDGEKLEQINICMLVGENTHLPVFSSLISENINDAASLHAFIQQIDALNKKSYKLVMDKGFYSPKNIISLLKKHKKFKFLVAMPCNNTKAREIILQGQAQFNNNQVFMLGDDIYSTKSLIEDAPYDSKLITYIFYNQKLNINKLNSTLTDILKLKQDIDNKIKNFDDDNDKQLKKYLIKGLDTDSGKDEILVNYDKVKDDNKNSGWIIIIGNDETLTNREVLTIYRNKDVVAKSFMQLKNNLDTNMIRVHSDKQVERKLFIVTISLILISYINNIMVKYNLYNKYSMTQLLLELEKIKILTINNKKILTTISKSNRKILEFFGIIIK